jgi:opacity protein-like surface antigen
MKKLALSLFAAAATLSTGAMAQTPFYVSGDVGQGHVSADWCTGLASCSNNGTAFKITGGYKFGQGFAAELGYIDFGKADASDVGGSAHLQASGFTLGGAYELPFATGWNGVARLGVASLETKVSGTGGSVSETNTEAYYGLGVNYAINKNVKIQGGIDWSHGELQGATTVVRAITVGARYDF